jgi:hypothetical protein
MPHKTYLSIFSHFKPVLLAAFLLALASSPAASTATEIPPVMRGTLWWITLDKDHPWTEARLREAIEAQCDIGFDLLWVFNTPQLLKTAIDSQTGESPNDLMATVFTIADEKGMRVISDLPLGGWYGKTSSEEMISEITGFAQRYHARYGQHRSFHGWYLNHEVNPIAPDDDAQSAYWRGVWKAAAETCHRLHPASIVTISPFFLLDAARRRGFVYLTPDQYAAWWGETLKQAGIDVLMLQDSGEHLSFFTLADREPFWAAVAKACHDAHVKFWVNIETGHAVVADWDEYLRLEAERKVPWAVTPMDWLEQKLRLAARYGDNIVNWGYFPYMDPQGGPEARKAYAAYQDYYKHILSYK